MYKRIHLQYDCYSFRTLSLSIFRSFVRGITSRSGAKVGPWPSFRVPTRRAQTDDLSLRDSMRPSQYGFVLWTVPVLIYFDMIWNFWHFWVNLYWLIILGYFGLIHVDISKALTGVVHSGSCTGKTTLHPKQIPKNDPWMNTDKTTARQHENCVNPRNVIPTVTDQIGKGKGVNLGIRQLATRLNIINVDHQCPQEFDHLKWYCRFSLPRFVVVPGFNYFSCYL